MEGIFNNVKAAARSENAHIAMKFVKDKGEEIADAIPVMAPQAADSYATDIAPNVQVAMNVVKEKEAEALEATSGVAEKAGAFKAEEGAKVEEGAPAAAEKAAKWAIENPCKSALVVTGGLMLVAPMAVAGPALAAIGLGNLGPIAGGLFSAFQGGAVGAGGFLATLQSAAMGGYGAAVVAGTVQGAGAAALGAAAAIKLTEEEETVEDEEDEIEESETEKQ